MQKWLASYAGKAVGVGDTPADVIGQALELITRN